MSVTDIKNIFLKCFVLVHHFIVCILHVTPLIHKQGFFKMK